MAIILFIVGGGSLYFLLMPIKEDKAMLEIIDFEYYEDTTILYIWFENKGARSAIDVIVEFRIQGCIFEDEIKSGEVWSIWVDVLYLNMSSLPSEYEFALSYKWTDSKGERGEFYPQLVEIEITKDHIT